MRRHVVVGAIALTLVNVPTSTQAESLPAAPTPPHPPVSATFGMPGWVRQAAAAVRAQQAARAQAAADASDTASMARLKRHQAAERAKIAKAKKILAHHKAVARARAKAAAAARARASRAAAARRALLTPSYVWAHKPFSIRVANCESGGGPSDHSSVYTGNAHLRDPNGHYGVWQFDYSTWRDVGGSGNPADASVTEQNARAYRLWQQRGWQPWQCARLVG
jgi:hypothetical protein